MLLDVPDLHDRSWHEIPDAIGRNASAEWTAFARIYFGVAVLVGGILGLSLGNAVFVDQMMADNNDVVERDVAEMTREVSLLRAEIRELRELLVRPALLNGDDLRSEHRAVAHACDVEK